MLWRASRRFLAGHPAQFLLAVVGIAAGVAVVTGVGLLRDALLDSLDRVDQTLAGENSVRVVAAAGALDEVKLAAVMRKPGAPAMLPVLTHRVRVSGQALELTGLDPTLARSGEFTGLPGPPAAGERQILLARDTANRLGLVQGEPLEIEVGARTRTLEWQALEAMPAGLADRLVTDLATAQWLSDRMGTVSHALAPADAMDWLGENLPEGLETRAAEQRRESAVRLTAGMRANLAGLSGLALGVGLFVVFSVLNFLFVQRRRSFAVLRAVGVRPGQLAGLMTREALFLGAVGVILGIGLGVGLSHGLLALVREPVGALYQNLPGRHIPVSVEFVLIIAGLGLAACLAAVAPVAREAARLPAGRLLVPPGPLVSIQVRLAGSLALVAVGGVLMLPPFGLAGALAGLFLILAGAAWTVPLAGDGLLGLAARVPAGGLWLRGLALLRAGRARIGPALSALALAIAVTVGIGMMISGFRVSVDDWVSRFLQADVYLTLEEGRIGDAASRAVADLPGLGSVSSARRTRLANDWTLVANDLPEPAWAGFDWRGVADDARERFEAGQAVLVTEPFSRRHGVDVGDRLELPGSGLPELAIAGVYRDYSTDQGLITLDGSTYRSAFGDDTRDSLGLYFDDGEIPSGLHAILAEKVPGGGSARLTTPAEIRDQTLGVFDRTFRITRALQLLVGLIAVVALVSALLAIALERAREYATLRALGLTRAGLGALITGQTLGLALLAALLAIPMALVIHLALSGVIQPRSFGWSLPVSWNFRPVLDVLPWVLAAGFAAGLYPAWKVARRDPAPWLKERH